MSSASDTSNSGIWKRHLAEWSRALFEGIDDAVFVHDLQGKILDANPAACRRLGYTREELLNLTTRDIDDPGFASEFDKRLEAQMVEGTLRCEGKHRTKDGRTILVDINSSAIEFHGKPCVLAVMRDITQQKKAELALVKQKELLRSILENMGDGVIVVDARGRLLLSNPVAQRLFNLAPRSGDGQTGWPPTEGMYLSDQVTPFPARAYPWLRVLQGTEVTEVQMFLAPPPPKPGAADAGRPAPRSRWISVTGRPLREGDKAVKGGILVCRDITDQKRAERRQEIQAAIARVITSAKPSDNLGRMLLKTLCGGLAWDMAVLWVVDARDKRLRCSHVWFRPELALTSLEKHTRETTHFQGHGLAGRVWAMAIPICVKDVFAEPSLERYRADFEANGLRSAFAFPIFSAGTMTGVVEAFGRGIEDPDEDLLALVGMLGSQLGQLLERQRVEHALRESQAFYYSLVESLPQNLFRKDREGRFTFGNQRYCQLLGLKLSELIGKTDHDLFPPELADKYREDDRRVMESGKPLQVVEEHSLHDGTKIYVEVIKTAIHDSAKNLIGVQGLFWDVTKRIRAEQEREASERRYRQLTEATQDAIVVTDDAGRITLFNPAAERMFGYAAAEVAGRSVELLMPPEEGARHRAGMGRYLRTRVGGMMGKPTELFARRKDGTLFPIEIVLTAMEAPTPAVPAADHKPGRGAGKGEIQFLGAIRDLTERNRIRSALVQSEKLASIGLLSAGVAHEINNPLAFIGNNLAVLQREIPAVMQVLDLFEACRGHVAAADPAAAAEIDRLSDEIDLGYIRSSLPRLLERTRDGVDRVARIVNSLRGLARTGKPERQKASLPDLVDTSLEIVRNRIKKKGIELQFDYCPDPVVWCVPSQISQVFLNLFVNSVQAIEAADRPDGEGRIAVRARKAGREMEIDFSDNGCGIDAEHRSRIFDPFFTTKDVGEGTGLGLSITHNIVTGHGGRIELDSAVGRGTTFRIFLPLSQE